MCACAVGHRAGWAHGHAPRPPWLPNPTHRNHSSGKSTFINHIAGRAVQSTGVAPTDDGFTLIVPGKEDVDQDGPALVGDPNLGFAGLRAFGGVLINHVALKVRKGLGLSNIMLIDSPGMIDSPISSPSNEIYESISTNASPRDRGFNFPATVRWFAERADVILLFFDPDKPGTTGETLAVMTNSLVGLEHKLHIVLNKVDAFSSVHDFARAYGSLCWNLAKVIPRKDLPRIYTMCNPQAGQKDARPAASSGNGHPSSQPSKAMSDALADLEATRREIVAEVHKAPLRRVDNLVTRLYDSSRLLAMHAQVLDAVREDWASERTKHGMLTAAALGLTAAGAGAAMSMGLLEFALPAAVLGVLGSAAVAWNGKRACDAISHRMVDGDGKGLDEVFRRVHFRALAERDDFVVSLWDRVRPQMLDAVRTFGLAGLPRVRKAELDALEDIVSNVVPRLRKAASKSAAFEEAAAEAAADEFERAVRQLPAKSE